MEEPLVSILCGCYNQSKFILESLESIKNQTYKNYEIIIWDDASRDNSVSIIEKWIAENPNKAITFIKHESNVGICKSLNEAQTYTKGKYIQLLALDDILLPNKITRHVQILENSSSQYALVFTDANLMDNNSQLFQNKFIALHKKYLSLKTGNFFDDLLRGNFIPAMSILYKKEILTKIGEWDEDLVYEDYDMLLRLAKNYDFIIDDEISVIYRLHDQNSHKNLETKMVEAKYKIYLKHINYNDRVNYLLKTYILKAYKNKTLNGEQVKYFEEIAPTNFREKWIMKNKNVKFYKIIERVITIKNNIISKNNH